MAKQGSKTPLQKAEERAAAKGKAAHKLWRATYEDARKFNGVARSIELADQVLSTLYKISNIKI